MSSGLDDYARKLRMRSTDAEKLLWRHLRAKRLMGLKFRRQEPIGKFIADFVCYERRVIIEVDGGQHSERPERDQGRDEWFKNKGFSILRFWNNDVLSQTEEVLEAIVKECTRSPSPSSPPVKGGVIRKVP
jgi:very-short-patch-repair endonuclease